VEQKRRRMSTEINFYGIVVRLSLKLLKSGWNAIQLEGLRLWRFVPD
jgi:hypothetical protein